MGNHSVASSGSRLLVSSTVTIMLQHTVRRKRRHSCRHGRSQEAGAGIICSVTLRSQHLALRSPYAVILPSSSSVFPAPLKDNISDVNIPLMSLPLLLKILSPNQIHQLALMLLLSALVSAEPRKLDLLSGSLSSSSSSSSFPLCTRTPSLLLSPDRDGFPACAFLPASLRA